MPAHAGSKSFRSALSSASTLTSIPKIKTSWRKPAQPTHALKPRHRPFALGVRARHLHPSFTIQHDLTLDLALARKARAALFRDQLGDRHGHHDGVADFNRRAEVQCLRNIDRAGTRQPRAEHCGNKTRSVKAMRNSGAERGLGGEMLGEMDWIAVAGQLREADHIGSSHRLV